MEKVLDEVWYCKNVVKKHFNKPLKMAEEDQNNFKKADECHICNKNIRKKTNELGIIVM